jgi:hypothetical protein
MQAVSNYLKFCSDFRGITRKLGSHFMGFNKNYIAVYGAELNTTMEKNVSKAALLRSYWPVLKSKPLALF